VREKDCYFELFVERERYERDMLCSKWNENSCEHLYQDARAMINAKHVPNFF